MGLRRGRPESGRGLSAAHPGQRARSGVPPRAPLGTGRADRRPDGTPRTGAPVPRRADDGRAPRGRGGDPEDRAADRGRGASCGRAPGVVHGAADARGDRRVPAGGAVLGRRRAASRSRDRGTGADPAATAPPDRRPGTLRTLLLLPGLPSARPLLHPCTAGHGGGPAARAARMADRARSADRQRVAAGDGALHRVCEGGRPGTGPSPAAGQARRRNPDVGRVGPRRRGVARCRGRRPARRRAGGLQGRRRPGAGVGRPAHDPVPGRGAGGAALGRAGSARCRDAIAVLPHRPRSDAVRGAPGAARPGGGGARRAALRVRPAGRHPLLALHVRAASRRVDGRGGAGAADRTLSGAVLRGVRGGVARRRGDRPVRRAGAARRPAVAGGGGAAGLRPLRPPARQPLRRARTWPTRCWRTRTAACALLGAVPGTVRPGAAATRRGTASQDARAGR